VCLKRHVSQIGKRQNTEIVRVAEHRRNWDRHFGEEPRNVDERQRVELERSGVKRQND
jgi:hypothetical protein